LVVLGVALGVPGTGLLLVALVASDALGPTLVAGLVGLGLLLGGGGGLLFTIGVAVHVFAPLRSSDEAARNYAGYGTILGCLYLAIVAANAINAVVLVLLTMSGQAGGPAAPTTMTGRAITPTGLILAALVQNAAILLILYLRIVRPRLITWRAMGLTGQDLSRRVALGVPVAFAVLVVAAILEALLSRLGLENTQAEMFQSLRGATPLQFVLLLLVIAGLTGFVEEAFFRGYVFQGLYLTKGARQAYVVGTLIFAALHLPPAPQRPDVLLFLSNWLALLVPIFVLALIFAVVFRRTGSIIPTVVAHAINNGAGLAIIYFGMA
jgi:membrane protease YdiL (CAAX protease family)